MTGSRTKLPTSNRRLPAKGQSFVALPADQQRAAALGVCTESGPSHFDKGRPCLSPRCITPKPETNIPMAPRPLLD